MKVEVLAYCLAQEEVVTLNEVGDTLGGKSAIFTLGVRHVASAVSLSFWRKRYGPGKSCMT